MAAIRVTFDTLNFVKRLEAAGEKPEIAEVQAQLQAELQAQILEKQEQAERQFLDKLAQYQPVLDEIKINKDQFATKSDIFSLGNRIDKLENTIDALDNKFTSKFDSLRHELIVKLGGIAVAYTTVLGVLITFVCHR